LKVDQHAQLVLERHLRVDSVQLEEMDALKSKSPEAHLGLLAQILRPGEGMPFIGPSAKKPSLRGDHQLGGVWVQRPADQLFADIRAVRVRGVD
jgi:hypothetical protein